METVIVKSYSSDSFVVEIDAMEYASAATAPKKVMKRML